jgi:hypothetical protein
MKHWTSEIEFLSSDYFEICYPVPVVVFHLTFGLPPGTPGVPQKVTWNTHLNITVSEIIMQEKTDYYFYFVWLVKKRKKTDDCFYFVRLVKKWNIRHMKLHLVNILRFAALNQRNQNLLNLCTDLCLIHINGFLFKCVNNFTEQFN